MIDSPSTSDGPAPAPAMKDEAVDRARDVATTAAEHAGAVTEEAKGKALDVAHDVRRELRTQGDEQAKRVASVLQDVGDQLHEMADAGKPGAVTDVTRHVASKSRRVAERLEGGGVKGLGDDLANFARRQPGVFLAAAGLAGFVATRLLRTVASDDASTTSRQHDMTPAPVVPPSAAAMAPEPSPSVLS